MGEVQETNMAIVRSVHEGVNRGYLTVFGEVLAENYVRHCQAMPPEAQEIRGVEPLVAFVRDHLSAFPDWKENIDLMFAADDKVAYVTTSTGTQTGQMGPFPPTGKRATLVCVIIQRLENHKIAETWISWDNVSFLQQLGQLPLSPSEE